MCTFLFPESQDSPKSPSSGHVHRKESQLQAITLYDICWHSLETDSFLKSLILLYCLFWWVVRCERRAVSSLEKVIYLNTWLLLLLSWLAFEIQCSLVWSSLETTPLSSSCINSSQLSPNLFPTVLALSHMFIHDSLTSLRQMPPLITINRSLQRSNLVRFSDQMGWVLFKYKVLLESLWGRWLSRAGGMGSWILVLFGYQRF